MLDPVPKEKREHDVLRNIDTDIRAESRTMRRSAMLLAVSLWGCAQPPTREIEIAAARVEQARAHGAAIYATESMKAAEASLSLAESELSERGSYRTAVRAAARACIQADEARRGALKETRRIRRIAERLTKECRAMIEEAHTMAPDQRESEELDAYSTRVDSIQRNLTEKQVSEALENASRLKDDLLRFLDRMKKARS